MARTEIATELHRIQDANGGLLRASDVVREASLPSSPLHDHFCWDDTTAAQQWRLQQARQLIRVVVEMLPYDEPHYLVRAFVSLTPDRVKEEGGYRSMATVMLSGPSRQQLLADALEALARIRDKYSKLKELAGVFRSIGRAERDYGSAPPPERDEEDQGGEQPSV